MQLIIAFAVLGSLLIAGGMLLRPVPPRQLRGTRVGSTVVLRPARWRYAILAAMAAGPTVLVAVVAGSAARRGPIGAWGDVAIAIAIGAGLAVTGYFALAERRMRVVVDDTGVERVDALSRRRLAWGQVERIAYNGVSRWFFLTGAGGVRVWIPEGMAGIGDFAELALRHLRPEVARAEPVTLEALEQVAAEARAEDAAGARTGPA